MKTFFELREKTLTPAELKKREEIAKAIKRENPNMPMGQKMAIATATAKKVAEDTTNLDEVSARTLGNYSVKAARQGNDRLAGQKMADEKMRKKDGYSSSAKVAAGSRTVAKEEVELDEISQSAKDQYIKKSASSFNHLSAVRKDATSRGDTTLAKMMRKRMDNRNKGMTRAFGGERD